MSENSKNCEQLLLEYKDLFSGIGEIDMEPYEFKVKPDSTGTVQFSHKVPFHLMNDLEKELKEMVDNKIIVKVNEPTEWVNRMLVVKKPKGGIRICLDPKNLNESLLREHFALPTFEQISSKFQGVKWFSTLDANKGFYQIKLTDKSSRMTTFMTHKGRYRFLRLPFGVSVAPEIFHRTFRELFEQVEGTEVYIDDIIVFGKTKEEHDRRLEKVLKIARSKGVKFNKLKCNFSQNSIKFLGHIFSEQGIQPDKDKVSGISNMSPPKNLKELEKFLGLCTYLSKFIPNFSEKTAFLRELTKKNVLWQWLEPQQRAFDDLKHILSEQPVLKYFDKNEDVILSVDASQSGLGAVIIQNEHPVAYASKSLTTTQQNYAQIEKETLAILYGCERFHSYLFGKKFIVESDHLPLQSIFKKPLDKVPARLQRMIIRLQQYDFTVVFKPSKKLVIADYLSRNFHEDENFPFDDNVQIFEAQARMILDGIFDVSDVNFKKFKNCSENDSTIKTLISFIRNGWPESKRNVPQNVKNFFSFRDELSVVENLVFKGTKLVVPHSLITETLRDLHYVHMGCEKTKLKAKEIFYWPSMNTHIEHFIANCSICQRYRKNDQKEELLCHKVPDRPWQVIGSDIFQFNNKNFLLVIDYYSKYVEVGHITSMTSFGVIALLKSIFARHGVPETFISDNGRQYDSHLFQ